MRDDHELDTAIVGVWIALNAATVVNGCMRLLAGAHRDGPKPHFMRHDWQICDDQIVGRRHLVAPMEPGDVLLFSSKLPHGTPTNHTNQKRWAVQFHFAPHSAVETMTPTASPSSAARVRT